MDTPPTPPVSPDLPSRSPEVGESRVGQTLHAVLNATRSGVRRTMEYVVASPAKITAGALLAYPWMQHSPSVLPLAGGVLFGLAAQDLKTYRDKQNKVRGLGGDTERKIIPLTGGELDDQIAKLQGKTAPAREA